MLVLRLGLELGQRSEVRGQGRGVELGNIQYVLGVSVGGPAAAVYDGSFLSMSSEAFSAHTEGEDMCPRFPQPVPLQHPIAPLKAALAQVTL